MYLSRQKRNWLLTMALCMSGAVLAVPASAHDGAHAGDHADHYQQWPQATLQAEAVAEIAQDTVRITLASEVSDATQAAVAQSLGKAVDAAMKQAKEKAKNNAKVKISSGNYGIWPMNDKDGKITNWRGRGEIIIESTDFAAASDIASALSDSMPVANLAFSVSPQAKAKKEETLLAQAARNFRDRAQALTDAFGFASYTIKNIDLGGSGARYESAAPRMMAMQADSRAKMPVESGTEMVSVSVQGSIFLQKDKK